MGFVRGLVMKALKIETSTIDDTTVGATTPAVGTFTTLTATTGIKLPSATVAAAGSDNTDAAAVAYGMTLVSASDGTKGVILPTAYAGAVCIVKNNVAAVLKVYPGASDAINALTTTTGAISMASLTSAIFVAYDATTWYTIPLLPS
jgi:hypothetical protein